MQFTPPKSASKKPKPSVEFKWGNGRYWIAVDNTSSHPKDSEIRTSLVECGYQVSQQKGPSYCVIGGTGEDLKNLCIELKAAYSEIPIDNSKKVSAIVKIMIETEHPEATFGPDFDAFECSKYDASLLSKIEAAKKILELL